MAGGLKTIVMGTGSENGVYYNLGKALAKKINSSLTQQGYIIKVAATNGSAENIKGLESGKFGLALVQSDVACKAYRGQERWCKIGACRDLRSVASLLGESVNLICANKSNIKTPRDLKGKRVAIGSPNSGTRANAIDVLEMYGLSVKDLAEADGSSSDKATQKFTQGKLDAIFLTIGHPNLLIYRLSEGPVPIRFIGLKQAVAHKAGMTFYIEVMVPSKHYPKATFPIDFLPTLGVRAVLMTTSGLPNKVAQVISEETYGNWVMLPDIHFAMYGIGPNKMQQNLCAPIHPEVKKYIKKRGY